MIKVMVAAILSGLAGAGCYFAFGQTILSFLPQLSSIPSLLTNGLTYVKSNLALIAGTLTVASAIGLPIIKFLNKRKQDNIQQLATEQVNEVQNAALGLSSENQTLRQNNSQLQEQLSSLQQANQNVAALQQSNTDLQNQVQRLINEKNEAERLVAALIPKEEKPKVH